jgi:DNA-directed RNA polymerase specialized sigma24 family protein
VEENTKDIALIKRILQGDATAQRELVRRHKDYAFTVAYRILNQREDAEEAAQDAFLKAFVALKDFQQTAKFTTWFYRIVFNSALVVSALTKARTTTPNSEGFGATFSRRCADDYAVLSPRTFARRNS